MSRPGTGRRKAFTLIELLVVLAIIGIMLAILGVALQKTVEGQKVRTLTVAVQTLIGEHEIAWGLLTAGGVIGALPVTALFMLIQRRLVAGMTQGAVKG